MKELSTCPACGAPLVPGRSGEMCPGCLLRAALGNDLPGSPASPEVAAFGEQRLPSIAERLGARIGRYKLLEQVGEGGFGLVWMAEQDEPVRRRVALKIIKPGMDTHSDIYSLGVLLYELLTARAIFCDIRFLHIVFGLGIACALVCIRSRSLWSASMVHWITVVVWVMFLGGRNLAQGGSMGV